MIRAPKIVSVKLSLPLLEISGTWQPNTAEREAAWELYIELVTRITVIPLNEDEGLLREALTSLYSMFPTTREVLRRHGPDLAAPKPGGEFNLGYLAVAMLNFALRPLLSRWHPALEDWEHQRSADLSRRDHEQAWPQAKDLRAALDEARQTLRAYADLLATACGVPNLIGTAVTAGPKSANSAG